MSCVELPLSLPGYSSHTTMKITYCIPDGIQGDKHPSPGSTFRGGVFEAYVPLSPKGWSLLPCLEKAFQQGRTFTVAMGNATGAGGKARVVWDSIPHRTKMEGGESGNGYPDPTYLSCLAEALRNHGFEGLMDMSHHKSKS